MSSRSARLLNEIAGAVADGESTDWGEAARKLRQEPAASQAVALELLASLGGRRTPAAIAHQLPRRFGDESRPALTMGALLILVSAQVICAAIGFLYGASTATPVPALPVLLTALSFGAGGWVLLRAGRADRRALLLGGFFLCTASAACQRFLTPESPVGAIAPALAACLPEAFLPYFLWRFTGEFPRVLRLDRLASLVKSAVMASCALGWILFSVNLATRLLALSGRSTPDAWTPLLRATTSLYWLLISALGLPAPLVAWARSRFADPEERRRVRLFLFGLAMGIMPLIVNVFAEAASPAVARAMTIPQVRARLAMFHYSLLLTVPLTTGYAVVAHRLLDVRLLLRRAARVAFARRAAAVMAVLASALLLLHLIGQRARPLASVFTERTTAALLLFASAGWGLFAARKHLLSRVERHLSGSLTDPALVLAGFAHEAQAVRGVAELARLVSRRLGELAGAEHAAMLFYDRERGSYASLEGRIRPVPASSALATLIAAVPEPAALAEEERESMAAWLVEEDRQWIADADAHLATPVLDVGGNKRALLIVGAARNALPYTREERRAITAFASTTSLALERVLAVDSVTVPEMRTLDEPAGECRGCGRVAEVAAGDCICGRPWTPAPIPYRLAGKFRLESILGQGGMGVVYRASDLSLSRTVALKTLPHLDSTALARLRREARSMAGFLHPNLALIFGLETWRGIPVLVVEHLAGGTLTARLGRHLGVQAVLKLGVALAAALEAMHGQEFLHRDVKPSNIGFAADQTPKLLDFGLSRLVEEARIEPREAAGEGLGEANAGLRITLTGQVAGTPLYLSPEALRGAPPAPAQDLWSLHLVLWEALAGRHPCAGLSLEASLERLAHDKVPELREVRPDCPEPVARLLADGLDPVQHRRPQTAAEVRESFAAVLRQVGSQRSESTGGSFNG